MNRKPKHIMILMLAAGSLSAVLLLIAARGTVHAAQISPSDGSGTARVVELSGVISAMDGETWTVAGQTVSVSGLVGLPAGVGVGDTVTLRVQITDDGHLEAHEMAQVVHAAHAADAPENHPSGGATLTRVDDHSGAVMHSPTSGETNIHHFTNPGGHNGGSRH